MMELNEGESESGLNGLGGLGGHEEEDEEPVLGPAFEGSRVGVLDVPGVVGLSGPEAERNGLRGLGRAVTTEI
jgi:hypothetical protein